MESFYKKTVFALAEESKCVSYQVGAIIVKDKRIISTGYNGTLPGFTNCNCVFDKDNFDKLEHHTWSLNNEIHAEQNALMMAAKHGISVNGADCYTSLQPCNTCLLLLAQAGIKNIYYYTEYPKIKYDEKFIADLKERGINLEKL